MGWPLVALCPPALLPPPPPHRLGAQQHRQPCGQRTLSLAGQPGTSLPSRTHACGAALTRSPGAPLGPGGPSCPVRPWGERQREGSRGHTGRTGPTEGTFLTERGPEAEKGLAWFSFRSSPPAIHLECPRPQRSEELVGAAGRGAHFSEPCSGPHKAPVVGGPWSWGQPGALRTHLAHLGLRGAQIRGVCLQISKSRQHFHPGCGLALSLSAAMARR